MRQCRGAVDAIVNGDRDALQIALAASAGPSQDRTDSRMTLLMVAACHGRAECVPILYEAGCLPGERAGAVWGQLRAIDFAVLGTDEATVAALLAHPACPGAGVEPSQATRQVVNAARSVPDALAYIATGYNRTPTVLSWLRTGRIRPGSSTEAARLRRALFWSRRSGHSPALIPYIRTFALCACRHRLPPEMTLMMCSFLPNVS